MSSNESQHAPVKQKSIKKSDRNNIRNSYEFKEVLGTYVNVFYWSIMTLKIKFYLKAVT